MLQRMSQRAIPTTETSPFQVQSAFILSAIFRTSLFEEKNQQIKVSPWPRLDIFLFLKSHVNYLILAYAELRHKGCPPKDVLTLWIINPVFLSSQKSNVADLLGDVPLMPSYNDA